MRNPPTSGPNATDAPATVPHAANAIARSGPSNVVDRIESVAGISSDAPMPSMIASPSTSMGTECDTDASSEPTPKITAPTMNMRRWPYMSPRRPPMISSVANVSEYPVITHCRLGRSVWNSRRIVGIATFSTVLSSTGMATDTITTAAANHRRGSGRSISDMGTHRCIRNGSHLADPGPGPEPVKNPRKSLGCSQGAHRVAPASWTATRSPPWISSEAMLDDR